ncbi:MAG: YceI family protein [Planctomycetota bacterium]
MSDENVYREPMRQDAMKMQNAICSCGRWWGARRAAARWVCMLGAVLVGFWSTSVAHGQLQQQSQQASLQAGDINTEFSRVYIFVDRSTSLGHAHGVEGRLLRGNILMDGSHPGTLVIDMKSFDADTPTGRKVFGLADDIDQATRKKVTENMLGAEVLHVSKYPEAKLENVKLTATGKTSDRKLPEYVMEGDFTLHNTTRTISATCDLEDKNGWNHLRGKFRIRQTDYGIKPYSRALGAVGVKDELLIYGDLWIAPSK